MYSKECIILSDLYIRVMNDRLGFIYFLSLFIFIFYFSIYFIFSFTLLYFILNLGKGYNMMLCMMII